MMSEPTYSVQLLKVGSEISPSPSVFWNDRFGKWTTLNYYAVLIRGEGRTILLNTGLPEEITEYQKFVREWCAGASVSREEDERIEIALGSVGLRPDQIDTVLFTPLTIYTTGSLHLFSESRFFLSRRGWIDYWAPDPCDLQLPREIIFPPSSLACLTGKARNRITLLDDEGEIYPGLRYFWTGGHHRSSVAYVVRTANGRIAFADCCFTYENLEKNIPIGLAESIHETLSAYHRLRREADTIIPLYDPKVLERHPGGCLA